MLRRSRRPETGLLVQVIISQDSSEEVQLLLSLDDDVGWVGWCTVISVHGKQ